MSPIASSILGTRIATLIIVLLSLFGVATAFSSTSHGRATRLAHPYTHDDSILKQRQTPLTLLNMQKKGLNEENISPVSLSAYTSEAIDYDDPRSAMQEVTIGRSNDAAIPEPSLFDRFIIPVLTASLMVTGNTVGAGMLVLPEVVAGPGPTLSFGVMVGAWMMCLISGLTIAQVAIQERESSGAEVPSSFKEFAEATLPSAANLVSGTSIFINTLVVAFDIFKAGQMGNSILPSSLSLDGMSLSYVYAGLLVCLVSTQSLKNLSQVASILVMGLFATFASLILPGLANVFDPASVFMMPPQLPTEEIGDGTLLMAPVVLSMLIFQNIVPTITRFLEYDRTKVVIALSVGSCIPLLMYMAWAVTVLGGGIDMSSASGPSLGVLMTGFSVTTVVGSTLGTSMSLSEEFEILLGSFGKDEEESRDKSIDSTFSLPSVALPIGIALVVAQAFSSDITECLKIAGAFGSPILYGLIPVSMAFMQQQQVNKDGDYGNTSPTMTETGENSSIIPGGAVGLGALTLASTALIGTELLQSI